MIKHLKKSLLIFLATLICIEPLLLSPQFARATPEDETQEGEANVSVDGGDDTPLSESGHSEAALSLLATTNGNGGNETTGIATTLREKILGPSEARIILNNKDYQAVNSLYCMSNIWPDFEIDLEKLYNNLPESKKPESIDALVKIKFENPTRFQDLIKEARVFWGQTPEARSALQAELDVVEQAKTNRQNAGEEPYTDTISYDSVKNLVCLTGLEPDRLLEADMDYLQSLVDSALKSTVIDIRIIKTLVYLVTPKNQGGAGHWRIRVKKLLQDTTRPYSSESENIRLSLGGVSSENNSSIDCANMTAAECGRAQNQEEYEEQEDSNIETEDEDGTTYDTYLETLDNEEIGAGSNPPERNISSHTDGQAVDIMEVDDIRCTLIVKKKRRVGGSSTKKTKRVIRPTKLAWQAEESYEDSGGNSIDIMGIMRDVAADEIGSLLNELSGDVTNYEGDLSNASFSDLIGIIGQSLFAQIVGSPEHDLSGFDTKDTIKKLGTMYFADYLGLPREIFLDREFSSLNDIESLIGESAIEKRAGLPLGSLNSMNYPTTRQSETKTYNLEGTLLNAGQRKLEYEMNLNPGDLNDYLQESGSNQSLDAIIGNRVIEKELSVPKSMFRGSNFRELKDNLGDLRAGLIFSDPAYVDNALHIPPGTTKNLKEGRLSPSDFIETVGSTRKNDTINGINYISANDSLYNLPEGTWENALLGQKDAFVTIGTSAIAKAIDNSLTFSKYVNSTAQNATESDIVALQGVSVDADPEDIGTAAAEAWLKGNLAKTDRNMCKFGQEIHQSINVKIVTSGSTEYKDLNIKISEDKAIELGLVEGDLSRMFGCAGANTRSVFERVGSKLLYYGIANKALGDSETEINLMDTDPDLRVSDPTINFYLTRINRIKDVVRSIKEEWEGQEGVDMGEANSQLSEAVNSLNSLDITNVQEAKSAIRNVAHNIDSLLAEFENIRIKSAALSAKIDATIININELIRAVSEILAGKPLASSSLLTIKQIKSSLSFDSNWARTTNGNRTSGSALDTRNNGFNVLSVYNFLTGKIDAADFFVRIGAGKAEEGLNLPSNSLYYLIQNYERAGIKNIDAFYMAIGQAKVENEFNMPSFYFQGDVLDKNMPDFNDVNKIPELIRYAGSVIETIQSYYAWDKSTEEFLRLQVLRDDTEYWSYIISEAKSNWIKEKEERDGKRMDETDLHDIAENVSNRNYNDGIRSAENDILFRMGISGNLSALEMGGGNPVADKQAKLADNRLGLDEGSTMALIRKQKVRLANGEDLLSDGEKSQLSEALNLKKDLIDVFLKLINGEISINELSKQGLGADYVNDNAYFKQYGDGIAEDTCPISYQVTQMGSTGGNFVSNNITWEDYKNRNAGLNNVYTERDTFCIVDKTGKHCFKNRNQAERYAVEHKSDQYSDILDAIADAISSYGAFGSGESLGNKDNIRQKLVAFINGNSDTVFSEEEYDAIENGGMSLSSLNFPALNADVLKRLFTREKDRRPLVSYKRAVGKAEAQKVISWSLFSSIGIDVPPGLFNPDDLYAIMQGDLKSLYRVGAYYVDESMGLEAGTTQMILSAANPNTLKCAVSQASATMLGSLVGLNSVPIKGNSINDIPKNIGQAKVEETLELTRGTFFGASLRDVIIQMQPMNFALAFNIPMTTGKADGVTQTVFSYEDMAAIVGAQKANSLKGATGQYQLRSILEYLSTAPGLTNEQRTAVSNIDNTILTTTVSFLNNYGSGGITIAGTQGDQKYELERFDKFARGLDNLFGLDAGTTAKLFTAVITPDQYNNKIGMKMIALTGAVALGELWGWDDDKVQAALQVAKNFKDFFSCPSTNAITGECESGYYRNFSELYDNLSIIFEFDLDSKAKLPPGTIDRILGNPDQAHWVLLEVSANKLDQQVRLNDGFFNSSTFTFSNLYHRVYSQVDGRADQRRAKDAQCVTDTVSASGLDQNQIRLRIAANQRLINKGKEAGATDQDKAAAAAAAAENASLDSDIKSLRTAIQTCQNGWRKADESEEGNLILDGYDSAILDWLKDGITDSIHNQIYNFKVDGVRVGIDMPAEDIEEIVFHGNLKYLEIATMAFAINMFQVKNDDRREYGAAPAGLRITYDDVKQAFFPDAAVLREARNAATWAYYSGEAADDSRNVGAYGDQCPEGDFVGILTHCTNDGVAGGPVRSEANLVSSSMDGVDRVYGFDRSNPNWAGGDTVLDQYRTDRANWQNQRQALITSAGCQSNPSSCQGQIENFDQMIENASFNIDEIDAVQREAERKAKKLIRENLEYRIMDQMIYGVDQNIFPGFARAVFKGDSKMKTRALATYVKNGLKNGSLFGMEFSAMRNVEEWLEVVGFLDDWSSTGFQDGTQALDNFINNGGLDFFGNYMAGKSQDWIGINIPTDMIKGLVIGSVTGKWGTFGLGADDPGNMYTSPSGKTIPTLGSAVSAWGTEQLFSWTDKALGLEKGTSYGWFEAGKQIYETTKNYRKLRAIADISNLTDARQIDYVRKVNGLKDGEALTNDHLNNAKGQMKVDVQSMKVQFTAMVVNYFVDKWFGEGIASLEEKWNLTPGSLGIVIDAAVSWGVAAVAHTAFGASSSIVSQAAGAFWVGVGIFVVMNLFGVYKVEVRLVCSADGYWPEMEPAPSSAVSDVSGIGTWDGMNSIVMKRKSIETAQYKASRLIGDLLTMQYNPAFKDIVPSQVMTGRREDVAFWNNTVDENVCKYIGMNSLGGVCGGNTRAGLWANPQTIAWTHIGF